MNFEERKAEILRRGRAKIARQKRKKRIILAALVIPVALVAALSLPAGRLLQGKSEEKTSQQMSFNQVDKELMADEKERLDTSASNSAAEVDPEYTIRETNAPVIATQPELAEIPMVSESILYASPPAITLTTAESASQVPMVVSQYWPIFNDGKAEGYYVQKALNVLYPGVVNVSLTTQSQTLTLDALAVAPSSVAVECWPTSSISQDLSRNQPPSKGVSVVGLPQEGGQVLYHIELLPGSYVYQIHLNWAFGSASYAFIATVE